MSRRPACFLLVLPPLPIIHAPLSCLGIRSAALLLPLFSSITGTLLGLPRTLCLEPDHGAPGANNEVEARNWASAYLLSHSRFLYGLDHEALLSGWAPLWFSSHAFLWCYNFPVPPPQRRKKGELLGEREAPTFLLQHRHQSAQGTVPPSPSLPSPLAASSNRCLHRPLQPASAITASTKLPAREKRKAHRTAAGKEAQLPDLAQDFFFLARPHYPSFPLSAGKRSSCWTGSVSPSLSGHTRGEKGD